MALGLLGVLAFSLTVPLTRIAAPVLGGTFVGVGRAAIATALAIPALVIFDRRIPPKRILLRLLGVGLAIVLGFPLFTSLALERVEAGHASLVIGLLPAATAGFAVFRAGERPSGRYWLALTVGLAGVSVFALSSGSGGLSWSDLLLVAAVASAGWGYTEGAVLTRDLGGWRVISWALVLTAPVTIPATVVLVPSAPGSAAAWLSFAYVGVVSMYLGFLAWYRGLALGGLAKVGQVQLIQPLLSLAWAFLLVGERVTTMHLVAAVIVLGSVVVGRKTLVSRRPSTPPSARG